MKLENTIIYLLGFAGVGKYTIAAELSRMTEAKVVDNHLTNNPVFHVLDNDGIKPLPSAVWEKTRAIRKIMIEAIKELSPAQLSFIFTNELFEKESHHKLFDQIADLAEARKAKFLCVRLVCNKDEIIRRIQSPNRKAMLKAIDPIMAAQKCEKYQILSPKAENVHTLDVSELSANEAAVEIISLLALKQ